VYPTLTKDSEGVERVDERERVAPEVVHERTRQRLQLVVREGMRHIAAFRKVDVRLPGKENSNSHGARPWVFVRAGSEPQNVFPGGGESLMNL